MENFATVVRTLVARIRAFEASRSGRNWPPTASATVDSSPVVGRDSAAYRVTPTAWGIASGGEADRRSPTDRSSNPGSPGCRSSDSQDRSARRRLELTVFELPVPRGLPST